jgi:regulator of RNase E activity RraA
MEFLNEDMRKRFLSLSTSNISDALDKIGIWGVVIGILPMYECPKIVGHAVTIKITAVGAYKPETHLGVDAIDAAEKGDLIVIDNRGDIKNNCWGEILSLGAKNKGIAGIVVDGAVRDIDACKDFDFPIYARGVVPVTARGRVMQESVNEIIRIGDVQVRPRDIVMADVNGTVVIPWERMQDVLESAEDIYAKELKMLNDLRSGMSIKEVDQKYNYEKMLSNDGHFDG